MSTVEEIEQAIERLSDQEKSKLRAWMDSLDTADEAKKRQEISSQLMQEEAKRLAAAVKLVESSSSSNQALRAGVVPPSKVSLAKYLDLAEWVAAFNDWVDSNRDVKAVADDSRESIYAGRGE